MGGLTDSKAHVITVSDGVSAGVREDGSGAAVQAYLEERGFEVTRSLVPDERDEIIAAIRVGAESAGLVLTTGGTGFGPRDVTPEATVSILEREAPGLVQVMIAGGLDVTPMAALSRARAGTIGDTLVVNLPGSPRGAIESLDAIIDVIPHALRLLSGDTGHH